MVTSIDYMCTSLEFGGAENKSWGTQLESEGTWDTDLKYMGQLRRKK
jgi:hypothetical protein